MRDPLGRRQIVDVMVLVLGACETRSERRLRCILESRMERYNCGRPHRALGYRIFHIILLQYGTLHPGIDRGTETHRCVTGAQFTTLVRRTDG